MTSGPSVPNRTKSQYHGQDITTLTTALREYHAIAYEIDMLRNTLEAAGTFAPGTTVANALIESFVMHFRTLASFLWDARTQRTRGTDALAVDFVNATWSPTRSKPNDLIDRVSREVAQLTTFRLSGSDPDKEWTPRECVGALLPTLEQFAAEIDPAKESPELKPAVERLQAFYASREPTITVILDTARSTTAGTTTKMIGEKPSAADLARQSETGRGA